MFVKKETKYLIIDIPELEKKNFLFSNIIFKIFGIESEKPILRLNNFLFESKWYIPTENFIFLKTKKSDNFCNFSCSIEQKSFLSSSEFFNYYSYKSKQYSKQKKTFIRKCLRLYRIPFLNIFNAY
nr:general transcription factor 3C polypeptide 6 [Cryptomonas paramecium]